MRPDCRIGRAVLPCVPDRGGRDGPLVLATRPSWGVGRIVLRAWCGASWKPMMLSRGMRSWTAEVGCSAWNPRQNPLAFHAGDDLRPEDDLRRVTICGVSPCRRTINPFAFRPSFTVSLKRSPSAEIRASAVSFGRRSLNTSRALSAHVEQIVPSAETHRERPQAAPCALEAVVTTFSGGGGRA
jgi:hypothetical protein